MSHRCREVTLKGFFCVCVCVSEFSSDTEHENWGLHCIALRCVALHCNVVICTNVCNDADIANEFLVDKLGNIGSPLVLL